MDSYYRQLVEREARHIRETVGITAYEGHTITTIRNGERTVEHSPVSALEMARKEVSDDHQLTKRLEDSVRINPDTGRAADIEFLAHHCDDIPSVPRSYRPFEGALYSISETVSANRYPEEDRQAIIGILEKLSRYQYLDNCMKGELGRAVYKMRQASIRDTKQPQADRLAGSTYKCF